MDITPTNSRFEEYLRKFDESHWQDALESLSKSVHPVDRSALKIWFRFHPLSLYRFLANGEPNAARRSVAMQGDFALDTQIDTSHQFLYGSRFWKAVKNEIEAENDGFDADDKALEEVIRRVASTAAGVIRNDPSLLIAITAVGMMTLAQVGIDKFKDASGSEDKPKGILAKSPEAVLASRKKDDSQGFFGFLRSVDKKYSVIHDERSNLRFEVLNDQEIASASANDQTQDWQSRDPRCWEGPVPVECTSASCGTCWVGVLAGSDKLSKISRREGRAIKVFGYDHGNDDEPLIRLACQAKAHGNVTIVIPPWNAVFGKKVYGDVDELELEPVTTSAKALREVVREARAIDSGDE